MRENEKSRRETKKLPPPPVESVEAEKFVLSAMTQFPDDKEMYAAVERILRPEDFYQPLHRKVFEAVGRVRKNGDDGKAFFGLVIEELRATLPEFREHIAEIMALSDIAHTSAYAERYARIVRDYSVKRQALETIANLGGEWQLSPIELMSKAEEIAASAKRRLFDDTDMTTLEEFFPEKFLAQVERVKKESRRTTGFTSLDKELRFLPGLYIIGGLPALGKTSFVWQLLEQIADAHNHEKADKKKAAAKKDEGEAAMKGEVAIFCSYEMSTLELFSKTLARRNYLSDKSTHFSAADFRCGAFDYFTNELVQILKTSGIDLRILQLQDEPIDVLISRLKNICAQLDKPPTIAIDYLQIIPPSSTKDSAKLGVDEVVRKLKIFQRDTQATLIVVSSINRASYTGGITFSSFKESGAVEYSADVVMGLQFYGVRNYGGTESADKKAKTDLEKAKKENPRRVQLRCVKNRFGRTFDCFFEYFPQFDYFNDCSEETLKALESESAGSKKLKPR